MRKRTCFGIIFLCHKSKRLRGGFTLIELMVVIAVISVLSKTVVPFFKKAYRTYKIYEVYYQADMLLSALLSHYLIMNEDNSSATGYRNVILDKFTAFLPRGFFDPTKYVDSYKNSRYLNLTSPEESSGWL